MNIVIVTDAWAPQVNGVVRTLRSVIAELEGAGHRVLVISPEGRLSVPCPTYPEIRLALATPAMIGARIAAFGADAIHIATEGPLGLAARAWCLKRRLPFTTAYHTQFPDYVARRMPVDAEWVWRFVRWFHAPSRAVLAATPSIDAALAAHGITHVRRWSRGVAPDFFAAMPDPAIAALPGPVMLYVGRVAVEKNIAAFLEADVLGSKVVVGDGPARATLAARHPDAHFLGTRSGAALAAAYAAADVFVFPSMTDTFGLVMIEALAAGTPVAAFPAPGPLDVLDEVCGAIDADLAIAIRRALTRDRATCVAHARGYSWSTSAAQFLDALAPLGAAQCAA